MHLNLSTDSPCSLDVDKQIGRDGLNQRRSCQATWTTPRGHLVMASTDLPPRDRQDPAST